MMTDQLNQAARNTLTTCFNLSKNDTFLLISDGQKPHLSKALESACADMGIRFFAHVLGQEVSYEPPEEVMPLLAKTTAALIATRRSYTHSDAVRTARKNGLRVATSPGIDEAQLIKGLAADYQGIAARAKFFAQKLQAANTVRLESPSGTNLRFSIKEQNGFAETGLYTTPGSVGNLPAGEASCGVDDNSANGVLVVNGSYPAVGKLSSPATFYIEQGSVTGVTGEHADAITNLLNKQGAQSRSLAELGIGLNSSFGISGSTLLDEKVAGTLHIGFGNDISFGGANSVPYHADAVLLDATLYLDDEAQDTTSA